MTTSFYVSYLIFDGHNALVADGGTVMEYGFALPRNVEEIQSLSHGLTHSLRRSGSIDRSHRIQVVAWSRMGE